MTDQLVTQLFANEILRFVMLFIIINLVGWILEKVSGVSTMIDSHVPLKGMCVCK